ncbi:Lsr2 family protein [Nocardioides sp. AN3]
MAQKVHIVLEDDLDGSEATETVSFALDGATYEIDLNDDHAAQLREALAVYVGHGRKVSGGRRSPRRAAASANGASAGSGSTASAKEIREWARQNGHDVPDRGRIPGEVRSAYESAH